MMDELRQKIEVLEAQLAEARKDAAYYAQLHKDAVRALEAESAQLATATEERDDLKAENTRINEIDRDLCIRRLDAEKRADAAEARERVLRGALERIASNPIHQPHESAGIYCVICDMRHMARAALSDTTSPGEVATHDCATDPVCIKGLAALGLAALASEDVPKSAAPSEPATERAVEAVAFLATSRGPLTDAELEIGRKAVEDALVELRDSRISMLNRGNGLVIRERTGEESSSIRMDVATALRIAWDAVRSAPEKTKAPEQRRALRPFEMNDIADDSTAGRKSAPETKAPNAEPRCRRCSHPLHVRGDNGCKCRNHPLPAAPEKKAGGEG